MQPSEKISQLPPYTTPLDGDYIPVVDVANNITKRTTRNLLLTAEPIIGANLVNSTFSGMQFNSLIPSNRLTNAYKFSAYLAGTVTMTNSPVKVTFDTKVFDTGSNYDTTNHRFVAPIAGFYLFTTTVGLSTGSSVQLTAFFYKNGVNVLQGGQLTAPFPIISFSQIIQLAANDFVEVFATAPSANLFAGSTVPVFSGFLVSAA